MVRKQIGNKKVNVYLMNKYIKELEEFANTNYIIAHKLYDEYIKKNHLMSVDKRLTVRPITENIRYLKTLSESINKTIEKMKMDL